MCAERERNEDRYIEMEGVRKGGRREGEREGCV
jgi:hypothetical protein